MPTINDFTNIIDFHKIVIVEWKVGYEVPLEAWLNDSSGIYYTAIPSYIGEIVQLQNNGENLERLFSYDDLIASGVMDAFFYDLENRILYVRISDDSATDVEPSGSYAFLVAFYWLGIINSQVEDYIVGFAPRFGEWDGATEPIFYYPFLDVASVPNVSQSVADYYTSALQIQFGSLSFLNNGFWWTLKNQEILLHNKDIWVKIGEKDSAYDDFVTIFPGVSLMPERGDERTTVQIKDRRTADFVEIPTTRINATDFPNAEESSIDAPLPILWGEKEDITPPCIDTVNFRYQISETVFNGVLYSMESVLYVYKDLVEMNVGAANDYTVDLNTGILTLIEDPGDANITIHARGIKCQYDFTASDPSTPTGVYSTNVADILYFILHELCQIPTARLDAATFADLQTQRTQQHGWYLESATQTMDLVRILQATIFHLVPQLDGSYIVRYYDRDTPPETLRFYDPDYTAFKLLEDTKMSFHEVVLKYDKKPSVDEWKTISKQTDEIEYLHGQKQTLNITTALTDDTEADGIVDFYLALVANPGDKIKTGLPPQAADLIPTDKLIVSRSIVNDEGDEVEIFDEEPFVLLQINKSIASARSQIVALRDTQARGISIHADIEYIDWYSDSYSDAGHVDIAHINSSYDDYDDVAHQDDHSDTPHSDSGHGDSYTDDYTDYYDKGYIDYFDGHDDHSDSEHVDIPYDDDYDDVAHEDDYEDTHADTPHSDGHGDQYTDDHGDQDHVDSEI